MRNAQEIGGAVTAVIIILVSFAPCAPAQRGVAYQIGIDLQTAATYRVRMEISDAGSGSLTLALPAWSFGEYSLNDAHEEIRNLTAIDMAGNRLVVDKPSDREWRIKRAASGKVLVTYICGGIPASTNLTGYFTQTSVLLEVPRALLYLKGGQDAPCTLTVRAPAEWKVVSSLEPGAAKGTLSAPSYDLLADGVTLAGRFSERKIMAGGVEHRLVLDRQGDTSALDTSRLAATVEKVVKASAFILGPLPFRRYLFVFTVDVSGSLGHPDSAVVGLGRGPDELNPLRVVGDGTRAYLQAWNGKRFRPKAFAPFEFEKENRTRSLWMTEGVNDYLATLVLRKARLLDRDSTLAALSRMILEHRNHHLSERVSPEDASYGIWDEGGRSSDMTTPRIQGAALGLLLDIRVRSSSGNKAALPDLIARGAERFQKTGYAPSDLERLATETARRDQAALFDAFVRKPGRLPWNEVLALAGLRFDWFLWKVKDPLLRVVADGGRLVVGPLPETAALHVAGLRPGDELMQVNQRKIRSPDDLDRAIASLKPGQKLRLDVRHDGRHRNIRLTLEDDVALVIPVNEMDGRVVITSVPAGPLAAAGILPGDVLEKIDRRRITRAADVDEALRRIRRGRTIITLRRAGKRKQFSVKAPPKLMWRGSLKVDKKAGASAAAVRDALLSSR